MEHIILITLCIFCSVPFLLCYFHYTLRIIVHIVHMFINFGCFFYKKKISYVIQHNENILVSFGFKFDQTKYFFFLVNFMVNLRLGGWLDVDYIILQLLIILLCVYTFHSLNSNKVDILYLFI